MRHERTRRRQKGEGNWEEGGRPAIKVHTRRPRHYEIRRNTEPLPIREAPYISEEADTQYGSTREAAKTKEQANKINKETSATTKTRTAGPRVPVDSI